MKHIRLFETQEQYDEVSYKLDYPCISLIEDEIDGSLIYEDEPSWVKCTYEIPQEALDGGTTSFLIMNNAKSVVKAYKVNGEMVDIEPEKVEEGVAVEVFQPMEMEGASTVYMPSLDACPLAETITTTTTFKLSRQVDVTSDYLLMVMYEGDTLAEEFPISIAELGTENFAMYYTFSEDGLSYSYADTLIQQLGAAFVGYGFGVFIVDADYVSNNGSINPPSITTTMIGRKVSGGLRTIEINQSVLGEDNRCVIEYKLKNDVKSITSTFNNLNYLKEIDFSGLKITESYYIQASAFIDNQTLEKVIFNKSDLHVGNYVFEGCTSLNEVDLSQLTSIEPYTFSGCTSLTDITIPSSLKTHNSFLRYIPNLTTLSFEEGYTEIEKHTCSYSRNLSTVIIPDSVTTIGEEAFMGCSNLKNIAMGNGVTDIQNSAFSGCSTLHTIELSSNITMIGDNAFSYCSGLTSINIPSSCKKVGKRAFYVAALRNAYIDAEEIGEEAFYYQKCLYNVTFGNNVKTIKKYAFNCCSYLRTIEIPESTQLIEEYAFGGCENLIQVTINSVDVQIGAGAFNACLIAQLTLKSLSPLNNLIFGQTYVPIYSDNNLDLSNYIENYPSCYLNSELETLNKDLNNYDIICVYQAANETTKIFNENNIITTMSVNGGEDIAPQSSITLNHGLNVIRFKLKDNTTSLFKSLFKQCPIIYCELNKNISVINEEVFYGCPITQFTISENIEKIENAAFANCARLQEINLPDSLTNISTTAFENCIALPMIDYCVVADNKFMVKFIKNYAYDSIETLNFDNNIKWIGKKCYQDANLFNTDIFIHKNIIGIDEYAFYTPYYLDNNINTIIVDNDNPFYNDGNGGNCLIETASNTLIKGCKNSVLPNDLQRISSNAFYRCLQLTSISIPNSIDTLPNGIFKQCTSLTSVSLSDTLKTIPYETFYNCKSLSDITVPISVTSIGSDAFYNCSSLPIINGVRYADTIAIHYESKFTSYTLKDNTKFIYYSCFSGNGTINEIILPNTVCYICDYAFSGCTNLANITIPDSVTYIGTLTFKGCTSLPVINNIIYADNKFAVDVTNTTLETYELQTTTQWIGDYVFYNLNNLTSITIPDSVLAIGSNNLTYCDKLISVNIGRGLADIGDSCFLDSPKLASLTVSEGNTVYDSRNNCNAIIETSTNTLMHGCAASFIPEDVTSIGEYAFNYITGLTSINIPKSVRTIDYGAFCNCYNLSSITISTGLVSIDSYVFAYCSALSSITCQAYISPKIPTSLFEKISSTGTLYYPKGSDYSTWIAALPEGWISQEVEFSEITEEA